MRSARGSTTTKATPIDARDAHRSAHSVRDSRTINNEAPLVIHGTEREPAVGDLDTTHLPTASSFRGSYPATDTVITSGPPPTTRDRVWTRRSRRRADDLGRQGCIPLLRRPDEEDTDEQSKP